MGPVTIPPFAWVVPFVIQISRRLRRTLFRGLVPSDCLPCCPTLACLPSNATDTYCYCTKLYRTVHKPIIWLATFVFRT